MESNKKILLLGAGEMQIPLIQCAKKMGLRTIVCDYDNNAPGWNYADVQYLVSTNDKDAVLEIAKKEQVDGITTSSDYPVRTVASVGRALGLNVLSENSAQICTDKYLQRSLFTSKGLLSPQFKLIEKPDILNEIKHSMQYPLIVKPIDSSASRGVSKVSNEKELCNAYEFARQYSRKEAVLVEEFIEGREFSVEVLIQDKRVNIIAITQKTTGGDRNAFFVEERHVIPADITKDEISIIHQTVTSGIIAAGLDNCASHTEVMLNKKGAFIIEMAARLGGDYITSDLVPLATGVSMLENVIKIAIGDKINKSKTINEYSGIRFVTPENYEKATAHFKSVKNDPRVKMISIKKKGPDDIYLKSSLDRLGHIIGCAPSRDSLFEILNF